MAQVPAAAQKALGLPPGFRIYSPYPFQGINLQSSPIAIGDQEFRWIENFFRLGDGYLRTAWDVGTTLYTAPPNTTIIHFWFYTIASTYYVAIFLSDGSAVQIDTNTLAQTQIGFAGTFYDADNPANIPAASQYGTLYLLISNRNTDNDYWAWDGSLLYGAGTVAPNGVLLTSGGRGYTSAPTISVYGGNGSGIALTPTLDGGSIVLITITNPGTGYQVGDVVQLAFSGGGTDSSAVMQAVLAPSTLAGVIVTAGGSGYTTAQIVLTGGGGSGAAATAVITDGVVTGVTVTNGGSGYTDSPVVTIIGDGSGASGVARLNGTYVATVSPVLGGSGFTSVPSVAFVGGGGAGATGVVNLVPTTVSRIDVTSGGSGYTSAPTVAINSASGTGATATAFVQNGQVVLISVTAPGSGYTDNPIVSFSGGGGSGATAKAYLTPTSVAGVYVQAGGNFYTSAPAVEISSVGNNSAYATLTFMPYGVSGGAIETFQSRVWLFDPAPPKFGNIPPGGNFVVSAPGSINDFATSDGGVQFTNSDSFLQTKYTGARQSNGYLYLFGDGSVNVVSNVLTSGSPATTTFNNQNIDPQNGLSWRDTRQDFGRSMVFANETGVYGLYGGAVTKVSQKLDQLFVNAIFPPTAGALTPVGAVATIFNVKHYLLLITIKDPDTQEFRNVMLTWNEKDWVVTTQSVPIVDLASQKVESAFTAWGTDGIHIFPLFQTPSSALSKRLDTKFYGGDKNFIIKDLWALWLTGEDISVDQSGFSGTVSFIGSGLASQAEDDASVPNVTSDASLIQQPIFNAPAPYWPVWGASVQLPFTAVGAKLVTNAEDFAIANLAVGNSDHTSVTG